MTLTVIQNNVLVAQSPRSDAEEMARVLAGAGFTTTLADTGAQAEELAAETIFAVAVVGTGLPDADLAGCIRTLQCCDRDLPCIAIAETATLEDAVAVAGLHVHGYLVQPIDGEQLVDKTTRAADYRRSQAALQNERLRSAQLLGILQTIDTVQDRINNPLQALLGYIELLNELIPAEATDARQFASKVSDSGQRISEVVDKLRQIRRPITRKWSFGEVLDLDAASLPLHERRAHPRIITVMLARLPGTDGRRWYFVDDVSEGGFSITIEEPEVLPNEMEVELADPESGETFCCRAQLVWADAKRSRAGLRFLRVDNRLRQRLRPA